jgi:hypothetical protein
MSREPMSAERLAEIRDLPYHAEPHLLEQARVDLLAEVDRLRAKLDAPCGSCHPCTNYADETWRAAGRTPPHVHEWEELRAEAERLRAQVDLMAKHLQRESLDAIDKALAERQVDG